MYRKQSYLSEMRHVTKSWSMPSVRLEIATHWLPMWPEIYHWHYFLELEAKMYDLATKFFYPVTSCWMDEKNNFKLCGAMLKVEMRHWTSWMLAKCCLILFKAQQATKESIGHSTMASTSLNSVSTQSDSWQTHLALVAKLTFEFHKHQKQMA